MFLIHLKLHEIELLVFFFEMLLLSRMFERAHIQTYLRYLF